MRSSQNDFVDNADRGMGYLDIVQLVLYSRAPAMLAIFAVTLFIFALAKLSSPALHPQEPPLIKSRVPMIGHIMGIMQHQTGYHMILSKKHSPAKCVTLPMLNGKLYAVYDPHLAQQVLRAKTASVDPFQEQFAQKVFGLGQVTYDKICFSSTVLKDFTDAVHQSFQTESLHEMNMRWLVDFAAKMDPISSLKAVVDPVNTGQETIAEEGGLEVGNFFLWCRDIMTLATTRALYGNHDPFFQNKSLIEDIWLFEEAIPYFLFLPAQSITVPRAYKARERLQNTMSRYYAAGHDISDPTTSTLTLNRANALRKHKFTGDEIGLLESVLPVVSTINAIPTLYWLLLYILRDPSLVKKIRTEVAVSAEVSQPDSTGRKTVTMDISRFEAELPLLVSCYRETMRLVNHSVGNRRMMDDLTITSQDGQTYLLKKGVDVQLPAGVTHRQISVWGSDAAEFGAERFVPLTAKATNADRARKAAYMPLGGGRHLCPGRNFAFAEIISFAAVLLLGFDVKPLGMEFEDMQMRDPQLVSGTVKPVSSGEGLGARIKVRGEYADVAWKFRA